MRKATLIGLALASLLASAAGLQASVLESPAKGASLSGIGFISGWKCDAESITVTIDEGDHLSVAMHQERGDLLIQKTCGETIRHGFIMQINWANVGDGEHTVVAYDDGVEFARSTFTVGTTGEEFVEEAWRRTVVNGWPSAGEIAVLEWNESTQHFELLGLRGGRAYDQAYWLQLHEDLDPHNWEDSLTPPYSNDEFLYAEVSDVNTCQAGRLTQAAKDRALEAMNQIRALHNLAPVHYSSRYDQQVQAAALIHAGVGRSVFSEPPPPGPSAQCYTEAGAEGWRTSSRGWALGMNWRDPAQHMAYLTERGHIRLLYDGPPPGRRWILDPFATYLSYGQVTGDGSFGPEVLYARKVFGFDDEPAVLPRVEVEYVAFPCPTYPFVLMEHREPWSFSLVEDKTSAEGNQHPYFDNATVSVTRVEDDSSLTVTSLYTDNQPFGIPNVLGWQVEDWDYDTLYEVEISNVAMQSGETRSFSYSVFIERESLEQ